MRRSIEFEGVNDLDAWLQSFIKDNEAWIPQTAASILSAEASRAFVEPALRIEPWAPLKASTRSRAGRVWRQRGAREFDGIGSVLLCLQDEKYSRH